MRADRECVDFIQCGKAPLTQAAAHSAFIARVHITYLENEELSSPNAWLIKGEAFIGAARSVDQVEDLGGANKTGVLTNRCCLFVWSKSLSDQGLVDWLRSVLSYP